MNKNLILGFILILGLSNSAYSDENIGLVRKIRGEAVTLICPGSRSGSGVVFKNKDRSYILTAAHVVELADLTGSKHDVTVYTDIYNRERFIRRHLTKARVVRYSARKTGLDIAVLEPENSNFGEGSVTFRTGEAAEVGSEVWHVGNWAGWLPGSVSTGKLAFLGRDSVTPGSPNRLDQLVIAHAPGSSGGGIWDSSGKYIGMITESTHSMTGVGFMVPVRAIISFLSKEGFEVK
jgi:S1-C subfamily serine protease